MHPLFVLSHYQITPLLQASQENLPAASTSIDLGLTHCEVELTQGGVVLPDGQSLAWGQLQAISADGNACYRVEAGEIYPVRAYSEFTQWAYTLYPTSGAPTMLISGIPMHRVKDTTPDRDTANKIKALAPITGRVLDTTTGLGYTAIEAARTASQVVTIELDPTALEIALQNPWSQDLFDNPHIRQIIGNSFEEIAHMEAESFDCIIHDPPTFSLAGELYSAAFYRQAWRVLKRDGRMFHYIGDPQSKSGAPTTRGVMRRLREVGFSKLVPKRRTFGVVAYK